MVDHLAQLAFELGLGIAGSLGVLVPGKDEKAALVAASREAAGRSQQAELITQW
ncbi:MAG: hypothetical protein R2748_33315 [Bryobacterales bacterium]